jgi:hypothetical protein
MSSSTLPPPIDRFVQAVNQGDSQTFLSFFPKDGVVIDSGWRFAGHDAVRRWSDREFIGAHGRMTVKKVEQKKNVVTESRLENQLLHRRGSLRVCARWRTGTGVAQKRRVILWENEKLVEFVIQRAMRYKLCHEPRHFGHFVRISLPDAFAMKSYVGILGTGLIFGALAGCAVKTWAT